MSLHDTNFFQPNCKSSLSRKGAFFSSKQKNDQDNAQEVKVYLTCQHVVGAPHLNIVLPELPPGLLALLVLAFSLVASLVSLTRC